MAQPQRQAHTSDDTDAGGDGDGTQQPTCQQGAAPKAAPGVDTDPHTEQPAAPAAATACGNNAAAAACSSSSSPPRVQQLRRQVTFPDDDAIAVVHHLAPTSSIGDASSCQDDTPRLSSGAPGAATSPGCWQRLQAAVSALKRDVLALYYACHDPRTPLLCKLLPWLTLAYALSPVDLIPDFVPLLGYLDDLLLLPLGLWLSCKLIPAEVMADARARAVAEPLRLGSNWLVAAVIVSLWTGGLLWAAHWLICARGSPRLQQYEWVVLGGGAGLAALVFAAWAAQQLARERRRQRQQQQQQQHRLQQEASLVEPLLAEGV